MRTETINSTIRAHVAGLHHAVSNPRKHYSKGMARNHAALLQKSLRGKDTNLLGRKQLADIRKTICMLPL